jgi:hypothetical protein
MQIETIKVNDLISFVESEAYKSSNRIAITRLRAMSQALNPRASADDIALIVAKDENNRILSYFGLLPDLIWIDNQPQKMWWSSCWWGDETVSNNGSMQLFYLACKLTNSSLYFPELTPETKFVLERIKKFSIKEFDNGVRGYLKLNFAGILPSRNSGFRKIKPLLSILDSIANTLYRPKLSIWKSRLATQNLNYEVIYQIDNETAQFISEHNENELFRRNKQELNWIIDNPWISTNDLQPNQDYAFTHHVKQFKNIPVKIYKNNQLSAFFLLLIHNGKAILTYCYYYQNTITDLVNVLYLQLLNNYIHTFTAFHSEISNHIQKSKNPFLFTRKQIKFVSFPKELESKISSSKIQHGDGDCAFV